MEGLIPLVYKAIVHYKNGGPGQEHVMDRWLNESPTGAYTRLPGDSGRFSATEIQLFQPDLGFSACETIAGQQNLMSTCRAVK